jgi:hypothetical protein
MLGAVMALLDDIRNHVAVMNPGQRERRTAVLLREAAAEIERLRSIAPSDSDSPQAIHARESQRLQPDRTPDEPSTPGDGTRQAECPYVTGKTTRYCTLTPFTLTDAERSAIVWCVEMAVSCATECEEELAALRGLLERTR